MPDWSIEDFAEPEDESDELVNEAFTNSDAVVFLIEATDSLLAPCPAAKESRSTLYQILETILFLERKKIVSSSRDQLGILIFNTNKTVRIKDEGWDNVYILQDVTPLDVDHIRAISNLLEKSEDDLKATFAPQDDASIFAQALKGASLLLRSRVPTVATRRIILITDNDSPMSGKNLDKAVVDAVVNRSRVAAEDLAELDVKIEPIFIEQSSSKFDPKAFYADCLRKHINLDDKHVVQSVLTDADDASKRVRDTIRTADGTRRAGFSIPFLFGEGFEIGIQGYNLVSKEKRKAYAWYDDETREGDLVGVKTVISDPYTHEPLDTKKDLQPYYPVGGLGGGSVKKALLKPEELSKLKTFGISPSLKLLGFKDRSVHRFEDQVNKAYFIYPNEKAYTGSKRTFLALLRSMLKKDKIGVGLFVPRTTSHPMFVHIFPQNEVLDEKTGRQTKPPGFQLVQLPFADDVRPPAIDETRSWVTDRNHAGGGEGAGEVVNSARKIIKELQFTTEYEPDNYSNPDLNWHYDLLAAIALEEDCPTPKDDTIPQYDEISNRAGELIKQFNQLVVNHPNSQAIAPSTTREQTSKRTRQKEANEVDIDEIRARFEAKSESKILVADLKAYCTLYSLSTKGLKADLVERVRKHLYP